MLRADNPFLQLTPPRVTHALDTLSSLMWESPRPVKLAFSGSQPNSRILEEARQETYCPVTLPFTWGKLFEMGWFHLRFPAAENGRVRYLHWRDQGEGTLFLGEVPHYGFDVAHRHVRLPDNVTEGWMEGLCLQSAIWHPEANGTTPEGSQLTYAEVVYRNDAAWKAYHELSVLYDLAKSEAKPSPEFPGLQENGSGYRPPVTTVSVVLRRVLRVLDDAVNALDRGGVNAVLEVLDQSRRVLSESPIPIRSVLTGHAHIDLVWLWPESNGEYKARHTFSTMNRLMDEYPEFRFAYSQSASYEAVEKRCPSLMQQVRRRVKEGKWEPVGATYVEMDNLIACGEALTRSFLVGRQSFHELFGESSNILWLPDVFGYAGCLPQIMLQCGVENFFTTKLTWSTINRFPYSSFIWRGTDGSEVLTHVTQELGYNQNATPGESRIAAKAYIQSDVHDAFLQPTGFGDGGGGPTPEMCERARVMAELGGVPRVGWGRLDEFFAGLQQVRSRLPHYQGELYLEYHRGTFTTHGDLKAAFRGLERALQVEEAANALLGKGPIGVHAWKRLIYSQFHDYIPGSGIREVYEEGVPELRALAKSALDNARRVCGVGDLVFNPLPLPRTHLLRTGLAVVLPPLAIVDPTGFTPLNVSAPVVENFLLRNDRVQAEMNEQGEVVRLKIDGENIEIKEPINQLWLYPDDPHHYSAWEIDRQTLSLGRPLETPVEVCSVESPPGTAALRFVRKVGNESRLELTYRLRAGSPVLEVELTVDWMEKAVMLRALFPTKYQGNFARFGSPYNSVLRGQQPGTPKNEAMFEACASRWAVVMDDNQSRGLQLVTEAKYGMGCRDGELGLSLLRSVRVTGEDDNYRKCFPEANRALSSREPFSDHFVHQIRYALGCFHPQQVREESPAALADLLYTPVLPASNVAETGFRGLNGGESLIPAWVKPLDDGSCILRMHEILGRSGHARILLAEGWTAARTRLAEDSEEPLSGTIDFRPYEIVSVRLSRT
ncbi:MAG: alpha-mannosidase [Kiritimatiellae bacterium]|jgi:alpha-mannosidase|nr:alpha-mannosidase [Kiritimatiellia bacterium]